MKEGVSHPTLAEEQSPIIIIIKNKTASFLFYLYTIFIIRGTYAPTCVCHIVLREFEGDPDY